MSNVAGSDWSADRERAVRLIEEGDYRGALSGLQQALREDPSGSSQALAALDSNFRVYGTKDLRVVDASVFPRIPGFFIVSVVYVIAEKAADVILADAARASP